MVSVLASSGVDRGFQPHGSRACLEWGRSWVPAPVGSNIVFVTATLNTQH